MCSDIQSTSYSISIIYTVQRETLAMGKITHNTKNPTYKHLWWNKFGELVKLVCASARLHIFVIQTNIQSYCKANNYEYLVSRPSQRKIPCGRAAIIYYLVKNYYHIKDKCYIYSWSYKCISIPMKPYIKGQYWMITTIPLDDNYQPGSYHPFG